ncbi:DUF1232 domain-containing protein [Candidatus Berkelbacteria bacterium]|nr:DUF1232 domain-containing protein [Candidatus Berkelbacteria bacterium]
MKEVEVKKTITDSKIIQIITVIVAIITLLSPLDIVPDLVPIAGFLDDAIAFLYLVVQLIRQFSKK